MLVCPADTAKAAPTTFAALTSSNLSFFVGLDANGQTPSRERCGTALVDAVALRANAANNYRWGGDIHLRAGNVGLADGSVHQTRDPQLRRLVVYTGDPNGNNHVQNP